MADPRFGVLGRLEVTIAGDQVDLGGLRPRMLLALLLSTGGQEVPFHRIVEVLWGAEPPATALGTVHSHLARLRRALEPDRPPRSPSRVLVRVGGGYAVRPAPGAFDADVFSALAAEGQDLIANGQLEPGRAALDQALGLWRGGAYADFPDASFALVAGRRLEEVRVQARIGRVTADVGLGRHEAVIPELSGLAREHPGREQLWQLLAVALYRSGRQVDALDVLREARETLAGRFGVDAGPGLRGLETAILRHEPLASGGPVIEVTSDVPPQDTDFVGRAADLVAVADLLRSARVVTVTGPPGVGKSRLVLEYGQRHADLTGIPTVWWPEEPGPATRLLVVDGAPSPRDVAAALDRAAAPGLRVLLAAREPLGVPGEALLELAPLPVGEAVDLFLTRMPGAAARAPGTADRRLAAAVCAAVGCLPAAVERAATLSRALPLAVLAAHLREDPTALLGPATDPLGGALTPADATLLGQLSVFEGGFDLDAMDAVAPGRRGRLPGLVDRSLIQVHRDGGTAHRYRMGRPLRQYARHLLDEDEGARAVRRHREWARRMAAEAATGLRTAAADDWLRRLHAERRNVRAALRSALADGDGAAAVDIAGGVAWYWFHDAATAEGTAWLRAALAAGGQDRSATGQSARSRALLGLSALRSIAGDVPDAVAQAHEAVWDAERAGHDYLRADALCCLSFVAAASGDATFAGEAATRAHRAAERVGWPDLLAQGRMVSGHARYLAGDLTAAAELLTEARHAARDCGYGWVVTVASWLGVEVALDQARYDDARHAALRLTSRLDDAPTVSSWLVTSLSLARALTLTGDGEAGALLWGAVTGIGRRVGLTAQAIGRANAHRNRHGAPAPRHADAYVRGLDMSRTEAGALIATLTP
ncbi:BTAD domain-containing putative transcriptional regulator [Dactylosporangium sp. CA-152071]|uniref:AfsR/SARP family transcriptional regulator n=1 Tax=Dactylosporangium sp. CA-152071 TaxID=3239933 RepID=UPI003D89C27E